MHMKLLLVLTLIATNAALSGCVPVAIGAGAAVVADSAMEKDGDDGLF